MITPSFGLTATERVLPRLALDFTTASLDSRVTFTRTTSASNPATYVNSSGLITAATNNEPRFDYTLNTGGACKGLLIEESRTNLALYSEQFDNAYWEKTTAGTASAPVVTQNAGVAPDGTTTAEQVDFSCGSTVSDRSMLRRAFTISNTTAYSGCVYVKAVAAGDIGKTVRFRTENVGAAVTVTLTSDWQRVASNGTSTSTSCTWVIETRGTLSSQTASVFLWGAQLEAGAFPTSYIPTTTTALTRNADVATMTGTNFSDWFNQSEGAITVQFQKPTAPVASSFIRAYEVSDGTTNNRMRIMLGATATDVFDVTSGGVSAGFCDVGAYSTNSVTKITGAYKTNSFVAAQNGGSPTTDTSGTVSWTMDRIVFGGNATGGGSYLNGYIQKFFYYPQRLTNNEARAFSK